jgi:hypothetical protein
MFTWEEAGQLRSMLLVLKWGLVAVIVGLVALEHEPLGAALNTGFHMVEGRLHPAAHAPSIEPADGH